jgi:hypothetical protein
MVDAAAACRRNFDAESLQRPENDLCLARVHNTASLGHEDYTSARRPVTIFIPEYAHFALQNRFTPLSTP